MADGGGQITDQVAELARARVKEALMGSVELELLTVDPSMMAHSRVDHVVSEERMMAPDGGAADEQLAAKVWGAADEAKIREFAERLANLKAA